MDPRLLRYYNRELQHLREMGGEFAREFPKIAGRLALEGFECADPYVERLLEGFAFLAARVQLKLDAEFPRFTQHLLETIYPQYLSPTPSMAVVQFRPDLNEGSLAAGFRIPRSTVLRSILGKGEQTPCEYRTAHDLDLWPLEVTEAQYYPYARDMRSMDLPEFPGVRAAIRLRLRTTAGLTFDKIDLERLCLYLQGADEIPMHIYEQLLANSVAVVLRPPERPAPWREVVDRSHIRRVGFDDGQALLPYGLRSFQGYRLLHEYFAFPRRFLFVEIGGLKQGIRRTKGDQLDILVLLDRSHAELDKILEPSNFALFCSPAINLFPKRADRIHLSEAQNEYHVVPDRTRPLDFEVYRVDEVVGFGTKAEQEREFRPFYSSTDLSCHDEDTAYYAVHRIPRVLSAKSRTAGPRSSYVGSEVFVSLVDAREAPYSTNLRQLALRTLCTNRDLPLQMSVGQGKTDFTMESGAPVASVRCLAGPTRPRPSYAEGDTAWRLISHLSLNYLSLVDSSEREGAMALRDILSLYGDMNDPITQKQIEGVKSITSRPVTRRVPTTGPIAFGRGLELALTLDEAHFEGTGSFLLGAVLDVFFSRYVSINSFTETVVRTVERGEVIRWPMRTGRRHTL